MAFKTEKEVRSPGAVHICQKRQCCIPGVYLARTGNLNKTFSAYIIPSRFSRSPVKVRETRGLESRIEVKW